MGDCLYRLGDSRVDVLDSVDIGGVEGMCIECGGLITEDEGLVVKIGNMRCCMRCFYLNYDVGEWGRG